MRATKRSFDNVGNIRINNLANFSSIISAIEDDALFIDTMPSFMKKVSAQEGEHCETKRQRLGPIQNENESICLPVKNTFPNPAWPLREGENIKTFLQKPIRFKPKGVCLKYWIKGDCHWKCSDAKSHRKDLHAGLTANMNKFVNDVRRLRAEASAKNSDTIRKE